MHGAHPKHQLQVTSPPPLPRRGVSVPPRKYCPRWKKGTEGYSRPMNQCLPLLSAENTHTHTQTAPKEGRRGSSAPCSRPLRQRGSTGSPRSRSALFPGRVSALAPSLFFSERAPQPPPRVFPSTAQCPFFYFTFLGSYQEPPGMIRNTWPLRAAGAQEIRTLKLEENQGSSRLGKKHRFRGWGCLCGGASPASSGRVRISCLLQTPRVPGSLGVH